MGVWGYEPLRRELVANLREDPIVARHVCSKSGVVIVSGTCLFFGESVSFDTNAEDNREQ